MECSICFDEITAKTGSSTLSCSHSFHFGCLVKWFGSQAEKDIHESCPCCRHEATDHERLPELEEEDEEEEDEEEEEEEEDEVALERARILFANQRASMTTEELETYAATRIQAAMRAYPIRMRWITYTMMGEQHEEAVARLNRTKEYLANNLREQEFHKKFMTMPRAEWRTFCATKIQSLCRGFLARKNVLKSFKVIWAYKNGVWARSVAHCTESWSAGLPPQSLAFQNHVFASRLQALWRGYLVRKTLSATGKSSTLVFV